MKSNIIKQTLYEMRRQPVAASVTLIGTAFAIFLMMSVMILNSVTTIPMAPESNRDRILYGMFMHTQSLDAENAWDGSSSALSLKAAKMLYSGLEGIDTVSYFSDLVAYDRVDVQMAGRPTKVLYRKRTDDTFWDIFDHRFIAGKPYDRSAVDAGADVAVLNETSAREILGMSPEEAIGRTVSVNHTPATVIGVIADHTPLADHAFGEIFMPVSEKSIWNFGDEYWEFGDITAALLLKPGYTVDDIKKQVAERYENLNARFAGENKRAVYHEQPYTTYVASMTAGSNGTPSTEEADRKNIIILLILLIVPAINMSSMTRSRLSRRMNETGIKRAYGSTRSRIIAEILTENFIITLIGGLIGLIFSIAGAWLMSETFFGGTTIEVSSIKVPWQLLFNWRVFAFALGSCLILNILSAGIPAWRASRVSPVDALRS